MKSISLKQLFISAFLFSAALPLWSKDRPTTRADLFPPVHPLKLAFPGQKDAIDYEKYGHFDGVGTKDYRYVIQDKQALGAAVGEGIYPNLQASKDPRYQELLKTKALAGKHWNFVDTKDPAANFYKWASAAEEPGVKQFYVAMMLERAGLIEQAIKAFYAVAVHFPKTISFTYYKTPWYVDPVALDNVNHLLRRHPSIKMQLVGGNMAIQGRYDNDLKNDVFISDPGKLINGPNRMVPRLDVSKMNVIKTVGGPHVQLRQYENHHWQLFVDSAPFQVKAITYSIVPVGMSPDRGTWDVSKDWQLVDTNKNGLNDGLFESYVDKNGNGKRDSNEPIVGDAKLMKQMGVNTLRAYHHLYNKELFRKLYKNYGFHVLCGDLIGMYTVGSGAKWADGTDYRNAEQQQNMLNSVRQMVEDYRDEPYILMWVLGNENVYGNQNSANRDPEGFFEFVNKAAQLIHQLDPSRPVAIANGDFLYLDKLKQKCPDVDVIGANAYRGEQGFGQHFFMTVRDLIDKPVLVTEYGASAYGENYTTAEVEAYQAMYLANNWDDLQFNMAGSGVGNALGGVLFEFVDEWWKANSDLPDYVQKERADWYAPRSAQYKDLQPDRHDTLPQFGFPFLDGWSYEEWLGVSSQGDGKDSPFCRVLRPAYFTIQTMWSKKNR